jgi:predicted lipid-binding transport protein (Tim44 family)
MRSSTSEGRIDPMTSQVPVPRPGAQRGRWVFALASVLALALTSVADARPGDRGSMGSRGSRTHDAPTATQTAPTPAQPIQRSQTSPGQTQPRPNAPAQPVGQRAGSRFGGGFLAGLLGAGLLGALLGAGLSGGLGSLTSILGLLVQIALIGGLIYLAVRLLRRRREPALAEAGAGGPMQRSTQDYAPVGSGSAALNPGLGLGTGAGLAAASSGAQFQPVLIGPDDYAAFERALQDIQKAYGREDVAALWEFATPEMAGYFQEELNENARKGVVNKISGVKLLQGDLSEAWREGSTEYATVAMRYAVQDSKVERASNRVVAGDPSKVDEVVEIWTFSRDNGGPWKLSAIQQSSEG